MDVADGPPDAGVAAEGPDVLLLGEANFSFALALASQLAGGGPSAAAEAYLGLPLAVAQRAHIVASCYESAEEVVQKYPEAVGILARLGAHRSSPCAEARFGVNGWDLAGTLGEELRWDVIAWNHPHLGTEDCRMHGRLLAHFFACSLRHLRPGGRIVLSLLEGQEARWELSVQAERLGLALSAPVQFRAGDFPGYECKRNTTGKSFKNLHSQRHAAPGTPEMRSWLHHARLSAECPVSEAPPSGVVLLPAAARDAARAARGGSADADPTSCRPAASATCDLCGRSFSCAQGLRTHRRQVHELQKYGEAWKPTAGEAFACPECGRCFRDQASLQQHRLAKHSAGAGGTAHPSRPPGEPGAAPPAAGEGEPQVGGETTPCEICGMRIPLGQSLEEHLQALRPLVTLELLCQLCGRSFVEARALEQHSAHCRGPASRMACRGACEKAHLSI